MGGRIWATSGGKDAGSAFHFTIRCPKLDARVRSPRPEVRHSLRQISDLRGLSLRNGEDRADGKSSDQNGAALAQSFSGITKRLRRCIETHMRIWQQWVPGFS